MGTSQEQGDSYEEFIFQLLSNIKKDERDIRDIKYGKENTILGISGCKHQIDVSFVDYSFTEPTLILIECKNTPSSPIEKVQVAAFKAIMDDVVSEPKSSQYVMGIFAHAYSARSGAIKFAKYYDIQMEQTGKKPNFTFKYENLIQVGIRLQSTSTLSCKAT